MSKVVFTKATIVEVDDRDRDWASFQVPAGTVGEQVDGDDRSVWVRVGTREPFVVKAPQGSVIVAGPAIQKAAR